MSFSVFEIKAEVEVKFEVRSIVQRFEDSFISDRKHTSKRFRSKQHRQARHRPEGLEVAVGGQEQKLARQYVVDHCGKAS